MENKFIHSFTHFLNNYLLCQLVVDRENSRPGNTIINKTDKISSELSSPVEIVNIKILKQINYIIITYNSIIIS